MIKQLCGLVLSLTVTSVFASPNPPKDPGACEGNLNGGRPAYEERLIHDERYAPEAAEYEAALQVVRDIADRLGLFRDIKRHVLEVMSPSALAALATTNRYPVGSYSDGAEIVRALQGESGILEFVLSGKNTQHSYYLSTLNLNKFISIVIHVYGHNFFHVHSYFKHKTSVDRVGTSYDLDQYMDELSKRVHPDEVEDWYFQLLSLEMAQDHWSGLYQEPKDMEPGATTDYREWADGLVQPSGPIQRRTESLFQAFVADLPKGTPEWKVEMAKKVEAMNRFIPGAISTKVVNEGFATICQEIVFEHLPESMRQFAHAAELGQMMSGVTVASKNNPYFIGVELWRPIREEFNQRPENRDLKPMDRDFKFFEYAQSLIGDPNFGNNLSFILQKMPNAWIKNRHLALIKRFSDEEARLLHDVPGGPGKPDSWTDKLFQVITHDPDRIRMQFMQDWNWHRHYPYLTWKNLHTQDDEIARFEVGGDVGLVTPVNRKTLGSALWMWAKVLRKKVEIEVTVLDEVVRQAHWFWGGMRTQNGKIIGYNLSRVKITVDLKGHLEVTPLKEIQVRDEETERSWWLGSGTTVKPASLTINDLAADGPDFKRIKESEEVALRKFIDDFQVDYNLDREAVGPIATHLPEILSAKETNQKRDLQSLLTTQMNGVASALSLNEIPPGVIRAVSAYEHKVARRFLAAFRHALTGGGLSPSLKGVRIKVLPTSPVVSFDRKAQSRISQMLSKVKDDPRNPFNEDDGLMFQANPLKDGSYYWEKAKDGGQGGDGDADGDGESGTDEEADDGNGDPNNGTGGGFDPTEIVIPFDLYQKLVGDEVELPNLRPLKGESEKMKRVATGATVGDRRPLALKKTAKKITALGLAALESGEGDGLEEDPFEVGLSLAQKTDVFTKSTKVIPDPDISAHITIIADNSGSMAMSLAKLRNIIFNLRMLLKNKYKNIIFTYIAFDGMAHVFEDHEEDKFFKVYLGGGTDYAIGTNKGIEVQQKFPESEYDRFVIVCGDLYEAHSEALKTATEQLAKQSRYFGVVKFAMEGMAPGASTGELEDYYKELAGRDPFVGFTEVDAAPEFNVIDILQKLFKTKKKPQTP